MLRGLPEEVVLQIADEARGGNIVTPDEVQGFRYRVLWEKERMMAELNCDVYHLPFRDPQPSNWDLPGPDW